MYTPLTKHKPQGINSEKKQRKKQREKEQREKEQREKEQREKEQKKRKHLGNVRVVQRNLVWVAGLPQRLADIEVRGFPMHRCAPSVCFCVCGQTDISIK